MPGAALTEATARRHVLKGHIAIKLGPMGANFAGEAEIWTLDETGLTRGVIEWQRPRQAQRDPGQGAESPTDLIERRRRRWDQGRGQRSPSRWPGPLAQFSRAGIVDRSWPTRLTAAFAEEPPGPARRRGQRPGRADPR